MRKQILVFTCIIASGIFVIACDKGEDTSAPAGPIIPPNPCAGKTLALVASSAATLPCVNNGSVTVTATGSSGFTYSIDGSGFQASNVFNNLAQGDHTYLVKDGDGCTKSASVNVSFVPPGPLFKAVKALIVTNCISCHSGTPPSGGKDFTNDCVILNSFSQIKKKVVDSTHLYLQQNGPLSTIDKNSILNWIFAGAKYSD